ALPYTTLFRSIDTIGREWTMSTLLSLGIKMARRAIMNKNRLWKSRWEMFFNGCYPTVCRTGNIGSQFVLPRPEPIQLSILFHTCFICPNHSGFTNGLLN